MIRIPFEAALAALVPLIAVVPSQQGANGPSEGRRYFAANCAACPSTSPGDNRIGPSLARIVGRKSGTVPGYNYSTGLTAANITWSDDSLDRWLEHPSDNVHSTRMTISVPTRSDRQNLIAYLRTL